MTSRLMDEQDAIMSHLTFKHGNEGGQYFSGFMAALRDARTVTGRDADTGTKLNSSATGNWLGALGYMALLDQVGSCFKPKSVSALPSHSIGKALTYFSSLPQQERDVLYTLRCAFAHDYSLSNARDGKGNIIKDPNLIHFFRVSQGADQLVRFPVSRWSGDYDTITSENETYVDLEKFGDLVESVYQKLLELAEQQQLDVTLAGGSDELIQRYGFFTGY